MLPPLPHIIGSVVKVPQINCGSLANENMEFEQQKERWNWWPATIGDTAEDSGKMPEIWLSIFWITKNTRRHTHLKINQIRQVGCSSTNPNSARQKSTTCLVLSHWSKFSLRISPFPDAESTFWTWIPIFHEKNSPVFMVKSHVFKEILVLMGQIPLLMVRYSR